MYDGNATVMCRPSELVFHLQSLFDAFTRYVEVHASAAVEPFRRILEARFREMTGGTGATRGSSSLHALFPESDELQRVRLEYVGGLLGLQTDDPERRCTVTRTAATQARLLPAYHQMHVLCDVAGRAEAMPLLEAFVDEWMRENTQTDESLDDPSRFWDALEGEYHETAEIAARLHRGKIAFRVNRCLWADVMRPLRDPELAQVGTCYGDFSQIAAINPNFVLTRTTTLMEGGPYCDTCIHDRRYADPVEHPSREFFDSLGTGV